MIHNDRHTDAIADCRLRGALDLFTHTWDAVVLAAYASAESGQSVPLPLGSPVVAGSR